MENFIRRKSSDNREMALSYLQRQWSVIPVQPRGKAPLVNWKEFQTRYPAKEEVLAWFNRWPMANVGIITGTISKLVIVDIDGLEGENSLKTLSIPTTVTALTGRGKQLYFRYGAEDVRTFAALLPGIDIRGAGGYGIAPYSVHANGRVYQWESTLSPENIELVDLPSSILRLIQTYPKATKLQNTGVIPDGRRNHTVYRLACGFAKSSYTAEHHLKRVLALNSQRCRPPLSYAAILDIHKRAWARKWERRKASGY